VLLGAADELTEQSARLGLCGLQFGGLGCFDLFDFVFYVIELETVEELGHSLAQSVVLLRQPAVHLEESAFQTFGLEVGLAGVTLGEEGVGRKVVAVEF